MGYPTVMTNVANVGAGLTVDLIPPVNQSFRVTLIGSDTWVGVLPNAIPDVNVSLFNGVLQGELLRGADLRGWYRKQNIVIDNTTYLRLTNNAIAGADLSYSAELIRYSGAGASIVRSGIITVGAGLTTDLRPATDTEDWLIHDVGSTNWLGAAPNGVPNVEVELNDGVAVARVMDATEVRQWEPEIKLFANRDDYITLTNAGLANANLCWSAELLRYSGTGMTVVRSDVQVCGAGLNVDFIPPAGEEWEVTMIGSSVWVGISPAQFPNITVFLFDGAVASQIQTPTSWHMNGHAYSIKVNNGNYLRINDAGGAGQNIGISAQLTQMYA